MNQKQIKLSRVFRHGRFVGYALSVDGALLTNQQQVIVESKAADTHPALTVTFTVTNEMTDGQDIHI